MRTIIVSLLLICSGCSTIGNLEPLNDTPLRGVRETAHTIHRTNQVLNGPQSPRLNTGAINRKYGEAKGLAERDVSWEDIPSVIQSLEYILR